jgi:hypothetical protein
MSTFELFQLGLPQRRRAVEAFLLPAVRASALRLPVIVEEVVVEVQVFSIRGFGQLVVLQLPAAVDRIRSRARACTHSPFAARASFGRAAGTMQQWHQAEGACTRDAQTLRRVDVMNRRSWRGGR